MCRGDLSAEWFIEQQKGEDYVQFDIMVEELGVAVPFRASPNEDFLDRLRPRRPDGRVKGINA